VAAFFFIPLFLLCIVYRLVQFYILLRMPAFFLYLYMLIPDYIAAQPSARQQVLKAIHNIIVSNDKTVSPVVEPMMGKEMIIYKGKGMMKYGLASVKNYMSLHVMPMYASPKIHDRYKVLLPKANFQKGCINFTAGTDMPLPIVEQFITDCAAVDLIKIKSDYLASKKTARQK
jgi:hypothetical protein